MGCKDFGPAEQDSQASMEPPDFFDELIRKGKWMNDRQWNAAVEPLEDSREVLLAFDGPDDRRVSFVMEPEAAQSLGIELLMGAAKAKRGEDDDE